MPVEGFSSDNIHTYMCGCVLNTWLEMRDTSGRGVPTTRLLKPQLHLYLPHKNYLYAHIPVSHLTLHHTAGVHLLSRPQSGVFSTTFFFMIVCIWLNFRMTWFALSCTHFKQMQRKKNLKSLDIILLEIDEQEVGMEAVLLAILCRK